MKKSKIPYLGSLRLFWCDNCNVPLLSNECDICRNKGRSVKITPPGDIRPAFSYEINLLKRILDEQFGALMETKKKKISDNIISQEKIVLINPIGGLDFKVEIIIDGFNFGILYFDIMDSQYHYTPSIYAGNLILNAYRELSEKLIPKSIYINKSASTFIIEGSSVLAPGVLRISEDIKKNDPILIIGMHPKAPDIEICLGIGRATHDYEDLMDMIKKRHGNLARIRHKFKKVKQDLFNRIVSLSKDKNNLEPDNEMNKELIKPEFIERLDNTEKPILNLYKAYLANKQYILRKEQQAIRFIKDTSERYKHPIAVAYSGGKDSLAVFSLVWKALGPKFKIFYVDTGLELPEVVENIKTLVKRFGFEEKIVIRSAGQKFWDLVKDFGPPARDFRFCCHSLKAQNIMEIIEKIYDGKKVLVFLGQRQYESINRAQNKMVYINSYVPLQIAATPIKSWNALLLWLYILYTPLRDIHGNGTFLPITSLYFKGHSRLGCYLCPASDLATLQNLRKSHPKLMEKWDSFLEEYRIKMNLPQEWVKLGLWRFKRYQGQWAELIKKLNLTKDLTGAKKNDRPLLKITKGFSPCINSGYSIKGKIINCPPLKENTGIIQTLFNQYQIDDELEIYSFRGTFKGHKYNGNIFSDGTFFIQTDDQKFDHAYFLELFYTNLLRITECTNCGTCISICPTKALSFKDGNITCNYEKCIHCLKCITHCPLKIESKKIFSLEESEN